MYMITKYKFKLRAALLVLLVTLSSAPLSFAQKAEPKNNFPVRGFHLDLRIQVMTMPYLKEFAMKLSKAGMNTLVMEYEATYPFQKHPMVSNRYAYSPEQIKEFIQYCSSIGIDVIPLQQSFGHVEYILRNYRYANLRESQKDFSQVCPSKPELNHELFTDLFTELATGHPSKYIHIGGDETYLLGQCPICKKKADAEGKSKLYIDHIKMLCDIVIKLGKRPLIWADIALKHPEAIKLLPKETVFVDWNYGWELNKFGNLDNLLKSGYEIWGSPSLRSHPDNYFLTQWEKHFKNIRDFVPTARKLGYKGMIMTSWSTSGIYSSVSESNTGDLVDLYAIRHVYPLTGFNILLAAYLEGVNGQKPIDITKFITSYCKDTYGFNKEQSERFWNALKTAPYEVINGKVVNKPDLSVQGLLDSVKLSAQVFHELKPLKNESEFAQYRLMTDIRVQYLTLQAIEKKVNEPGFTADQIYPMLKQLEDLIAKADTLNQQFTALNKGYYHPAELETENQVRKARMQILYDRLSKSK